MPGAGGSACGARSLQTNTMPVDAYVMFDQSSSMGDPLPDGSGTWWTAAQAAVTSFVNDPRTAGMGVGIQYFSLNGVAPASCTAPYSTPEVEIAPLPGNAAAIASSIQAHAPTAFTPTAPALQGAIDHMKAWAPAHPGRTPVVVLVTDGFPTECQLQQISDIAAIARTGFETAPAVRTFVIGFNLAVGGTNLDSIAKAGGSSAAFLINAGAIGSQFVAAMLSIDSTPLSCSFPMPSAGVPDLGRVAVLFTPKATGISDQVVKVNALGDCALNQGQGWYYDSPNAPTKILVCPGTCAGLASGVIDLVDGCTPVLGITR